METVRIHITKWKRSIAKDPPLPKKSQQRFYHLSTISPPSNPRRDLSVPGITLASPSQSHEPSGQRGVEEEVDLRDGLWSFLTGPSWHIVPREDRTLPQCMGDAYLIMQWDAVHHGRKITL